MLFQLYHIINFYEYIYLQFKFNKKTNKLLLQNKTKLTEYRSEFEQLKNK